mgnify:CR=1 FL=1
MVRAAGPAPQLVALRQDRAPLDPILAEGSAKARSLAAPTLNAAYAALGLVRG